MVWCWSPELGKILQPPRSTGRPSQWSPVVAQVTRPELLLQGRILWKRDLRFMVLLIIHHHIENDEQLSARVVFYTLCCVPLVTIFAPGLSVTAPVTLAGAWLLLAADCSLGPDMKPLPNIKQGDMMSFNSLVANKTKYSGFRRLRLYIKSAISHSHMDGVDHTVLIVNESFEFWVVMNSSQAQPIWEWFVLPWSDQNSKVWQNKSLPSTQQFN